MEGQFAQRYSKCFDIKSLHPSDLSKTFWLSARPAQLGTRVTKRFAQDNTAGAGQKDENTEASASLPPTPFPPTPPNTHSTEITTVSAPLHRDNNCVCTALPSLPADDFCLVPVTV